LVGKYSVDSASIFGASTTENGAYDDVLGGTYGLVLGGGGGDGALGAAVAGVGGVDDGDVVFAWRGGLGVGRGKDREDEGDDLGMHFEDFEVGNGSRPSEW
jgi:hypothetical protein